MIEVQVEHIQEKGKRDLAAKALNAAADKLAAIIKNDAKDKQCPNHPNQISVLVIIADTKGFIKTDKSHCCCEEFAKQVNISIKYHSQDFL